MNKDYYNTISNLELQKGGYYLQRIAFFEKELGKFKIKSKKDLLILNLVCNEGKLSKIYSKYGEAIGVNLSEDAVCKANANGIETICGDVYPPLV